MQEAQVPDEVLLEAIRNLADELGRVPTALEMDVKGAPSVGTQVLHRVFGPLNG
ncbi:homing endonuclease associated repeat-containing protein [Natrinema salaciae]|uniref:homing endonuclease associated repeat-containing protein n=1 Tax=Natrinema salaciae TaxID=1186196 RepID=UPI001FDFC77A|nr:hypothetical protein [Natrinema salaciae]